MNANVLDSNKSLVSYESVKFIAALQELKPFRDLALCRVDRLLVCVAILCADSMKSKWVSLGVRLGLVSRGFIQIIQ